MCDVERGKLLPQRAKTKPSTGLILKHPHKGKTKRAKGRIKTIKSSQNKRFPILELSTIRLNMTDFPATSTL